MPDVHDLSDEEERRLINDILNASKPTKEESIHEMVRILKECKVLRITHPEWDL